MYLGSPAIANVSLQESSAVVQKALDALAATQSVNFGYPPIAPSQSLGGGRIELPKGVFKGDLYIGNRNTELVGHGEGTIIDGSIFVNAGQCRLRRLTVVRPLTSPYCIKLSWTGAANKADRIVLDGVSTYGGDTGLLIDATILTTVKHSYFLFPQTYACRVQRTVPPYGSPSVQPTNTTLKFLDCGFQGSQDKGIYITQSGNTSIRDCNFESNTTHDIHCDGVEGVTIQGCNIEDYIDKAAMLQLTNMTAPCSILGNWFSSGYGDTAGTDMYGNPAFGTHSPTRAILIQNSAAGGIILANRFLKQKGANGNGTGITNDVSDVGSARWISRQNQYSPATLTYRNLQTGGDTPPNQETN